MSEAVQVALIAAGAPVILQLLSMWQQARNQRRVTEKLQENTETMNGHLAKLVEAKEGVAHAAGAEQERGEERARVEAKAK